jgi:hypothetical protein
MNSLLSLEEQVLQLCLCKEGPIRMFPNELAKLDDLDRRRQSPLLESGNDWRSRRGCLELPEGRDDLGGEEPYENPPM